MRMRRAILILVVVVGAAAIAFALVVRSRRAARVGQEPPAGLLVRTYDIGDFRGDVLPRFDVSPSLLAERRVRDGRDELVELMRIPVEWEPHRKCEIHRLGDRLIVVQNAENHQWIPRYLEILRNLRKVSP